jgi:hypothetical protein
MKSMQNFIMRPYRAIATACTLLLTAGLLFGCSAARLGYSNGEMLSYWWLDSYVEFNSDQRRWVKKELANLFAWHRKTQLPEYVRFLKHAETRVQNQVTETELRDDYDKIKKHILILTDRALPVLAELALSLNPQQVDNIEKKLASNNDDYRKEYLDGNLEKRQRLRYKKTLKQAENWFGSFSTEQEQQIRALSDVRPLNNELVLADRMQRQAALISLLRKIQADKPERDIAMSMIRNYVAAAIDRSLSPEHKRYFDAFRASSIHMTAAIINGTTPAQKAHFLKTTQQWINDFTALSK